MSLTHKINITSALSGISRTLSKTFQDAGAQILEIDVAASQSNIQHVFDLDVSQLIAIVILATTDVKIETNNASTPTDTLDVNANVPYIWTNLNPSLGTGAGGADAVTKFSADITDLFISEQSSTPAAGKVYVHALYDTTP